MFLKFKPVLLFSFLLLLLPGCLQRTIRITGTSYADTAVIADGFVKGKSFSIVGESHINGIKQNNELQTKELAKKISIVLESLGYRVEQNPCYADYSIFFTYGSDKETKVLNMPKYIPGQTATSQGTVSGSYGYYGQYQQQDSTSGTFVYMPEEHTFYTKFLCCYVYDTKQLQSSNNAPQVWHGVVWNVDECSDLRESLDFLLIKLFSTFGKSLQRTMTSDMAEDDEKVVRLCRAYLNPQKISFIYTEPKKKMRTKKAR